MLLQKLYTYIYICILRNIGKVKRILFVGVANHFHRPIRVKENLAKNQPGGIIYYSNKIEFMVVLTIF